MKSFKMNVDFWTSMEGFVNPDGFVRHERYDEALETFRKLRDDGLKILQGPERERFEEQTRWTARPVE